MLTTLNDTQQIIRKINQVKLYKEYNIDNFLEYPFVVSQKPLNMIREKNPKSTYLFIKYDNISRNKSHNAENKSYW